MMAVILVWFTALKRPIYEAILISFAVLLTIGGKWANVFGYIYSGLSTSLLYSMTVFVAMSIILTKTKIIDGAIEIILALLGKVSGGAGYVAVFAAAFMGAFSGSGPGNVMATGSITIPAMKKSGFPGELAANITTASSSLGNLIPPSATLLAAMGVYNGLYPGSEVSSGTFWIACWGCALWFIVQRLIMVFAFVKKEKIEPMAKEDIPALKTVLKTGWRGLLLPVVIFVPFLLDYLFKDNLFTERLTAAGAKQMSGSLLYFTAGIAVLYTMIIIKDKKDVTPRAMSKLFGEKIKSIVPTIAICLFGYMFGALFKDLDIASGIEAAIGSWGFGKTGLCLIIPLLTAVLGMVIVGSSMVVVFGGVFVSLLAGAGVNPLLAAAMLPCICAVMSNMVPPIAPAFLSGVSLADSDFGKSVKNGLLWVAGQYVLEVLILLGVLPVFGV